MEIEIDYTKSAQENASDYYGKSKKLLKRKEGALKAIKDLESKLLKLQQIQQKPERRILKEVKREWYEKFHWFYTSDNMLAIGGRDAHQNELLNSRYFDEKDLFFHADIFGASPIILKDGASAGKETRQEVAEFAAAYSSAWKEGLHSVDVYAMRRDQVSKSTSKGSLGTGSFLLSGERDWYRNMPLCLVMFVKDERLWAVPQSAFRKMNINVINAKVTQGNYKKSDAAKKIAEKINYQDIDVIMRQLPSGSFRIE